MYSEILILYHHNDVLFDYQTIETTDSDLQGIESNATESGTCAKGHELEGMCKNNDEQECKESVICKWCQNSCNADTDELAICDEKYNTLLVGTEK